MKIFKPKFPIQLLITIFLTLGLSISFQSLLAAWTAPTFAPPGGALPDLMNLGDDYQYKTGGVGIGDSIVAGKYIIGNDVNFDIKQSTTDGVDIKRTRIGGGGDVQSIRGAYIEMYGNESLQDGVYNKGNLNLFAGDEGNVTVMNGNFGIGLYEPMSPLHVMKNWGTEGVPMVNLQSTNDGDVLYVKNTASNQADKRIAEFRNNDGPIMSIRGNGKINIGSNNDPTQTLDVYGGSALRGTVFIGNGFYSTIRKITAGTQLQFVNSDGSNVEMAIDGNGNVGIGTTNPTRKLDVAGALGVYGDLLVQTNSLTTAYINYTGADNANNNILFVGKNGIEHLGVKTNGNVGIGISNPTVKLDVNGSIKASGTICDNNGCISAGSSVPAKAIMAFNLTTCPPGWIPSDGLNGTPDLRGRFVRGMETFDNGVTYGNNDPDRSGGASDLGSIQSDTFASHRHDAPADAMNIVNGNPDRSAFSNQGQALTGDPVWRTAATGGAETRPKNVALIYCVKQ